MTCAPARPARPTERPSADSGGHASPAWPPDLVSAMALQGGRVVRVTPISCAAVPFALSDRLVEALTELGGPVVAFERRDGDGSST